MALECFVLIWTWSYWYKWWNSLRVLINDRIIVLFFSILSPLSLQLQLPEHEIDRRGEKKGNWEAGGSGGGGSAMGEGENWCITPLERWQTLGPRHMRRTRRELTWPPTSTSPRPFPFPCCPGIDLVSFQRTGWWWRWWVSREGEETTATSPPISIAPYFVTAYIVLFPPSLLCLANPFWVIWLCLRLPPPPPNPPFHPLTYTVS